jgi:hypothetical protein
MNSFVNSSLSSVSAHFHTPTELNTPKSIQFQNEKKKIPIYQDNVIFSPRLSNFFCRLYFRLAYNNV